MTDDSETRTANLFRDGISQAVRIPKEFEFNSEKVAISRRTDGTLVLRPEPRTMTLAEALDWLKAQGPDPDFPGDPGSDDLAPLDDVKR